MSTRNPWATSTRRSAEIRSPASSRTTSPGTRSAASTSTTIPSRSTVTRRGSRSARRSAARSARYSWTKANIPLSRTTTTMATPSWGSCARKASPAATHSITAKNPRNCRARWRHTGRRRAPGSTLGPSSDRRREASAEVSPCTTASSQHPTRPGHATVEEGGSLGRWRGPGSATPPGTAPSAASSSTPLDVLERAHRRPAVPRRPQRRPASDDAAGLRGPQRRTDRRACARSSKAAASAGTRPSSASTSAGSTTRSPRSCARSSTWSATPSTTASSDDLASGDDRRQELAQDVADERHARARHAARPTWPARCKGLEQHDFVSSGGGAALRGAHRASSASSSCSSTSTSCRARWRTCPPRTWPA